MQIDIFYNTGQRHCHLYPCLCAERGGGQLACMTVSQYLEEQPCVRRDEMAYYLFDRHSVDISARSVSRFFAECRWSRKVAKEVAT
jgi:nicotinic acid mononucleotide adenylyltransferase